MKLHIDIKNERGGKKGTSDDTRILTELYYGNKLVGTIGLYSIIDDKVEGYRIVFNDPEKGYSDKNVIKELEKGKIQKGDKIICNECAGMSEEDKKAINHKCYN